MLVKLTIRTTYDDSRFPMEIMEEEYELLKHISKCSMETAAKTGKNMTLTVEPWYEESEEEKDGK